MSDYTISLAPAAGGASVRCVSARLVTRWAGCWFADLDLDPDSNPVTEADVPTGKVTIAISVPGGSTTTLTGSVDPDASGRFVSSVPVRVRGGLGWSKAGNRQAWHSDAGVSSVTVESSAAALVGETVNDQAPVLLGTDWSLNADQSAASVFGDRAWYVDTTGVTQVGVRPVAQPDPTVEILEWDPIHAHGMLSADALVLPGTVLSDPRFDGPISVRDTVQTWDRGGTRVEFWCGASQAGRLQAAMTNVVRALAGISHLRRYRYRIVTQASDGRLTLQAVAKPDGTPSDAPDVSPLSVTPGMSGLSALFATSSECTVAFVGDPAVAFVESFDSTIPIELTLNASGVVHVGPDATVKLAENASDYTDANVTCNGDPVQVMLPPLCPLSGTISGVPIPPGTLFLSVAFPLPGVVIGGRSKVLA